MPSRSPGVVSPQQQFSRLVQTALSEAVPLRDLAKILKCGSRSDADPAVHLLRPTVRTRRPQPTPDLCPLEKDTWSMPSFPTRFLPWSQCRL